MNNIYKDLIYLLSCSVNGTLPDKKRVKNMDLDKLYNLAKFHSVSSALCIVLEEIGIKEEKFDQAYKKAVRKNILFDVEKKSIFDDFEKNKIWYMPLKGSILKELYSKNGMREMADNDILFDKNKQNEVKNIMLSHGYTTKVFRKSNHDVYIKPPVCNFELHTELFGSSHAEPLYKYYQDVKKLFKKDKNSNYGFHLSDEDFYVYITAHEWKHFNGGGCGIRSLLDCYVYINNKGDLLNFKYIKEQTKKLEISDFEEKRRKLAIKVFSSNEIPSLSEDELQMLMYYLTSGTYGTFENSIRHKLKNQSKWSFIFHSIFIPYKKMKVSVPFTNKSFLLYPIGLIWRTCRILLFKTNQLKITIREVKKHDKQML